MKEISLDNMIKVLDKGFVRLIDTMGSDVAVVQAARVSYGEGTKKVSDDENLIRYLMRHDHMTPFEMCQIKFHIKAPIFIFRQWHRSRTWSFNEISGRYSELPDEYYVPQESDVTFQSSSNKQGGTDDIITPLNIKNPDDWWDCISAEEMNQMWSWGEYFSNEQNINRQQYEKYLNSGMRKELARINLCVSQYSEMYASVDLRNLFHFLKLRLDSHAQYEIRVYAQAMYDLIKPKFPLCCAAFEDYDLQSVNFSKKDLNGLAELLSISDKEKINQTADNLFTNKREKEEFIAKINSLITINKNILAS